MTVLLGSIKSKKLGQTYRNTGGNPVTDYVSIYQFIDKKETRKNMFFIVYNEQRNRRFYKYTSPLYKGTYENFVYETLITMFIESIDKDINAQYHTNYNIYRKITEFKRLYKYYTQ